MGYAVTTMEGRLVANPEFRDGKNGEYCTFSLAVNQRLGPQENTSYYDCIANGQMAQRIKKAGLAKGYLISLTGNQTIRESVDRNNIPRKSVSIGVVRWDFAGSKPKGEDHSNTGSPRPATTQSQPSALPADVDVTDEDELPL